MKTIITTVFLILSMNGFSQTTQPSVYKVIGDVTTYDWESKNVITFTSGLMIDADGAPKAYNKDNTVALDYLGNAGSPGDWWALVTDNGKADGNPIIQKETDPAPGYYISTTSLVDNTKKADDPARYVDSETIPYIALPSSFSKDFTKGDIALVINTKNNQRCFAIFADIGPKNKIGEGSIFLASQLGINSSPKKGGASSGILYILIKNSGMKKVLTNSEIQEIGAQKLPEAYVDEIMKQ